MRQTTLLGVNIDVVDGQAPDPTGRTAPMKVVVIQDQQAGEVIHIPLPLPVAEEVAAKLRGVFIATQMPQNGNGGGA
jgi:hypothetical protein